MDAIRETGLIAFAKRHSIIIVVEMFRRKNKSPPASALAPRPRQYRYLGDGTAMVELKGDINLLVDTRSIDIAAGLIIHGFWEEWIEPYIIGYLKPGMTFVDVGANIGYFSVLGGRAIWPNGLVIACEPNPRSCDLLRKNLRSVNGIPAEVHKLALGAYCGETTLYVDAAETGGAFLTHDSRGARSDRHVEIPITLKSLDAVVGDRNVDLIKIDVEGFEPDVLMGAKRTLELSRQLRLIVELSPDSWRGQGHAPIEVLRGLTNEGFSFSLLTKEGPQPMRADDMLAHSEKLPYVTCFMAERSLGR